MTNNYWQPDPAGEVTIAVAKPRLPSLEQIAPYLRQIEQSQWYSNGGPLVQELERRLESHIDDGRARVATVANATVGLTVALMAYNLPANSLCMVPAWTFAATAHAIQLAGLLPWIVDVSESNWALEAAAARELLREAPDKVSAVVPVFPFGAPIEGAAAWERFAEETGIAVVIDAAAAFDTVRAAKVPAVVSLHATKVLGIGEGGFVVCTDASFIEEVQKRANFGFWYSREAMARSFNGKMSEYAAAVGLAALDSWTATRADFARVARAYRAAFEYSPAITMQHGFGTDWVTSTVVVGAKKYGADQIARALSAKQIGSRRWWGGGLHRHRAFRDFPCHNITCTEALVETVIGLPCWRDLPQENIAYIGEVVSSAIG